MIDEVIILRRGSVSSDGCPVPPLRVCHSKHIGREHVAQDGVKPSTKLSPMKKPIKEHADAGSSKSPAKKRRHDSD